MIRIIADTSTMYSSCQAKESGFDVAPLSVTIGGKSYRELDDITSADFVQLIHQGHMPTSSQPAIGDVLELYQQYPQDEIINISMADGLSGTYGSASSAAGMCAHKDSISVVNTRTLCGPHRYLVEEAVRMAREGLGRAEIIKKLEKLMKTGKSFLLPADFDYLRRGGRLSPLVSFVGKTIKLAPVLTQSEDGRQLVMAGVKRNFRQAVSFVGKALENWGVGANWRVYITHADAQDLADKAREMLSEVFPHAVYEVHPLTPAFITQGGPGCVAIQVIQCG